ncbi:hypothetical protein FACS189490_06930 [Clostridia bacterium]|nr:hypothetical protein FACS189490_06930 [Clostridia bacterium]
MNIILFVLLVIGYVLLGILGLLILLLLLMLLPPIHYSVYVNKAEVSAYVRFLILRVFIRNGGAEIYLLWHRFKTKEKPAEKISDEPKKEPKKIVIGAKQAKKPKKIKEKPKKTEKTSVWKQILAVLDYPNKAEILGYVKTLIVEEFSAIKPRKFTCNGVIGFDDPSMTGFVIGGIWAVNGLIPFTLNVAGDFNEKKFELLIKALGRVSLWSLTWPLIKFCLRKPVWAIIKEMLFD